MKRALTYQDVIFGFVEVDDNNDPTLGQYIPPQVTVSSTSVDVDPEPKVGWIESNGSFYSPEIDWDTAQEIVAFDPTMDLVSLLKGTQTPSFAWYKKEICDLIDANTQILFGRGAQFDGKVFSLSGQAQRNWGTLFTLFALGRIPTDIAISTLDNRSYLLTTGKMAAFFDIINYYVYQAILPSGRDLKETVMQSTDISWLQAFVDPRM